MRTASVLAVAILAGCAAPRDDLSTGRHEAALANELRGREAGATMTCVNLRDLRGHTLFPRESAVVFDGPGNVRYLNRFSHSCPNLRWGLSLQLSTPTGRLCEGEIVQIFDATAGIGHGACPLGPFISYRPSES